MTAADADYGGCEICGGYAEVAPCTGRISPNARPMIIPENGATIYVVKANDPDAEWATWWACAICRDWRPPNRRGRKVHDG